MKSAMNISMEYDGGIALFDPEVFCNYLESINLIDGNIFELFIKNKKVGDRAIADGVIIPIYPVDEDDYIFVNLNIENIDCKWEFEYDGFPLRIESGILVATDIFSLMSWEHEFFRSYKENYKKRSRVNDMIDLVPGMYSVGISGGISDSKKIYGLQFGIVEELPRLGQAIDSDSFDFNI